MKKREPISHIMTANVLTLHRKQSLMDAESIMRSNHVRHVPVVSGDEVIGMLSMTDLQRVSFVDSFEGEGSVDTAIYEMLSIDQVMTHNVKSIESSATIKDVAEILSKEEFHAMPVTENGKLVGIVSTTDVLKYLLEQY